MREVSPFRRTLSPPTHLRPTSPRLPWLIPVNKVRHADHPLGSSYAPSSLTRLDWSHRPYHASYPSTLHSSTSSPYSPPPSLGLSPLSHTRTIPDHLAHRPASSSSTLPVKDDGADKDGMLVDNDVRFSSEVLLSLSKSQGQGLGINLGPRAVGTDQVRRISESTEEASEDELEVRTSAADLARAESVPSDN